MRVSEVTGRAILAWGNQGALTGKRYPTLRRVRWAVASHASRILPSGQGNLCDLQIKPDQLHTQEGRLHMTRFFTGVSAYHSNLWNTTPEVEKTILLQPLRHCRVPLTRALTHLAVLEAALDDHERIVNASVRLLHELANGKRGSGGIDLKEWNGGTSA